MDREFIERLKDYFTPCELIDLLEEEITVEDICYAFEDVINENEDMLMDYMEHGR